MQRALCVSCCCLLVAGCAAFAGKSDYLDYRAARMEQNDAGKLLAMQRYAARHPTGRWHDEVQRERLRRDKEVFESGKSERAGLELYLAAFPDGAFAVQAKSRLSAVGVIEQRKRDDAQRAARLAEERKRQDAELTRTWVTRFFGYWAKTLLSIGNWGAPIEQVARANPEFSRAFGRPPRPRCTSDECVKYYESAYAVPVPGGTRIERVMRLILRLRMEGGQVVRAELLMPGAGFSRWQELEERRAVVDGDAEARKQAVDWAIARILPLLDPAAADRQPIDAFPAPQIAKPAISPSGELVDTTAEDPGAPSNRIQGEVAATPEPTVTELIKPAAPEQAPDMELAPLRVGQNGTSMGSAAPPEPVPVPQEGAVLDMAPVAVPQAGAAAAAPAPVTRGAAAVPSQPSIEAPQPLPSVTKAFRSGGLRIVLFAAGTDDKALAYDGLIIERVAETPAPTTKRPAVPRKRAAKPTEPAAAH